MDQTDIIARLTNKVHRLNTQVATLKAELTQQSHNSASAEICSTLICRYCVTYDNDGTGPTCEPCHDFDNFVGRKLRA